ncbi:MAG TPA: alpha/beta hydrolase [Candidatus Binatia bacterium]|jgi:non-heme chloroperoxidase|nr:alpha/beta hydrolase [Candidatus Binatia bacterium]
MSESGRVTFEVGQLTLVGDAWGDPAAPAVILLHGGGQTRHAWGGTAAALAAAGRYAVTVDLRGHGDSTWDTDGDYSVDAFARDLRAMAATFPGKPAVVGASLGGLATLIAQGEGDDPPASAVVLVDIAPRVDQAGVGRIIGFMTGNPDGFATLDDAADAVAGYMVHRPRPKDLDGLRKNLRLGEDGRFRWHWDPRLIRGDKRPSATQQPDRLEAAARAIRVPMLLVRGRMSDVVSEEGARAFLAVAPGARYVDVSGAGHMVAGDRNDAFSDAVVRFLADGAL